MVNYAGQIVKATVLDIRRDDTLYQIITSIETGDLTGQKCLVPYWGDTNKLRDKKDSIVIRLNGHYRRRPDLGLEGRIDTGNFITSPVPDKFTYANSEEVILYGLWQEDMKQESMIPYFETVSKHYDLRLMWLILYYANVGGRITPYSIISGEHPRIIEKSPGRPRNVSYALRKYLSTMEGHTIHGTPRVVIIDEGIKNRDEMILKEFEKIIRSDRFEINKSIHMEPQK